jgi:hypothetical protein
MPFNCIHIQFRPKNISVNGEALLCLERKKERSDIAARRGSVQRDWYT